MKVWKAVKRDAYDGAQQVRRDRRVAVFTHVANDALRRFFADRCPMMSASVAFYSAFSLAPTLLIVLAVIGWFFGGGAGGRLFDEVRSLLGNDAAAAIQTIAEHAHRSGGSGVAAYLSTFLVVIGASATFASLNSALDIVFDAKSPKGIKGLALVLRVRLVSFALLMGIAFLLVVSLVLDATILSIGRAVLGDTMAVVAEVAQTLFGLAVLTAGLGALIAWLPDRDVPPMPAMTGGFVAAVLFTVGRQLFGMYLAHAGTAGAFGAAGSLAVLMMWLYFSAAVFLFGSEVSAAICRQREDEAEATAARRRAGAQQS